MSVISVIGVCSTGTVTMTEEPRSTVSEACPTDASSTKNPTGNGPQSKPRRLCQRPAADCLSHGTAFDVIRKWPLGQQQQRDECRELRRRAVLVAANTTCVIAEAGAPTQMRQRQDGPDGNLTEPREASAADFRLWSTTAHNCRTAEDFGG